MYRHISFTLILVICLFSCKKSIDYSVQPDEIDTPLLYKILDSTLSISTEDRILFYYNKSDLVDSFIYQTQFTGVTPASWRNSRLSIEYNNSQQAIKVTKREVADPEHTYSEITYNTNGSIKSIINYGFTYKFNYDMAGRLVSDSQYNSFGIWESVNTYEYDLKGNVIRMGLKSAFSNSVFYTNYTYDSAINPLYKKYEMSMPVPSPTNLSPNNITSIENSLRMNYTYNRYNLPLKATIHISGRTEPLIRTYIYY